MPELANSSTYVRELHAITAVVQKWLHYLLAKQFIIQTDQKRVKELMNQIVPTPDQHYYLSILLGYDYVIVYKQGKTNSVADSRRDSLSTSCLCILTIPSFDFLTILSNETQVLLDLQEITKSLWKEPQVDQIFQLSMESYIMKNKPILGENSTLKKYLHWISCHSNRWSHMCLQNF